MCSGLHRMTMVRQRRQDNVTDLLAGWSPEDVRTLAAMFTRYNAAVTDHYLTSAPACQSVAHAPTTSVIVAG